jgi:hypothetical protein
VFGLNSAARYLMGETFELDTFGFNAWHAQLLLELKTKIRFYPVTALIWQPKNRKIVIFQRKATESCKPNLLSSRYHCETISLHEQDYHEPENKKYQSWSRELLLKGKAKHSWPPWWDSLFYKNEKSVKTS